MVATTSKQLMSGAEALARAVLALGHGPLIASASPPLEDLARVAGAEGGVLAFQDSEAAGLAFGAAAAGAVPLLAVAGSGLGRISEVLSAACAAELPMVVAAAMRGGTGSGNDFPAQGDYLLATRSPGPGGAAVPVLAPCGPRELVELYPEAVELAAEERTPVLVLLDALVARTREAVALPAAPASPPRYAHGVGASAASSVLGATPQAKVATEALDHHLWHKARGWEGRGRAVTLGVEDAELLLVAYGSAARIALTTHEKARKRGIRLGILRPVHLRPFPDDELREVLSRVRGVLVVELCEGQMLADVRRLAPPEVRVAFYGRMGGAVPTAFELMHEVQELAGGLS